MDSSPEVERFGISDADYEYMFDPLKRKKFQSQKQQIYGVFASDSDSDLEESGMGTKASIRNRKNQKYSGPITFVSGGIKEGSKNQTTEEVEGELDIEISDEEEDKKLFSKETPVDSSDRERPTISVHPQRRPPNPSAHRSFGSWERHTKGIGMKLLQKMGFKAGEGLGKEGQGIVTPVEAVKRSGKGAVGSMGTEVAPVPRKGNEPLPLTTESKDDKSGIPRYRKRDAAIPQKASQKPIYLSADELISRVSPATPTAAVNLHRVFHQNTEPSRVKVIDMTSREQRVYDGYEAALGSAIRHTKRHDDEDAGAVDAAARLRERRIEGRLFEVPVLCHNIDLVIKATEDEIRRLDRGARYDEDRMAGLEHEIGRLAGVIEKAAVEEDDLSSALELIDQFEVVLSRNLDSGDLTPDTCTDWLNRIRRVCASLPELPALLAAIARPLLDKLLASWRPLANPSYGQAVLKEWRSTLDDPGAFEILLRSSWLPQLRRSIVSEWDPHDCESLLAVLESWKCVLPENLLHHDILLGLVLHRLRAAVDDWDPLSDTVPIHTWLHPWLPWFGGVCSESGYTPLSTVHEVVLAKLAICLKNWHPSDSSASSVLAPWRSVLPIPQITIFLNRNITPKLTLVMQSLQINPADQNMEPWHWVMRWLDIIDAAVIADLLERFFLARWLSCLSGWLGQAVEARNRRVPTAGQIFSEIGAWYSGWKSQIPPELMEYPSVKDALTRALALMEGAMRGIPPPNLSSNLPGRPPAFMVPRPPRPPLPLQHPMVVPLLTNLRDQIEQMAAQRGLLFMPLPNRFYEGKQVFRLENQQIYFERNVAFCYNAADSGWHPVTVTDLMSMSE